MKIDTRKMNKAEILSILYNNSKPLGMGYLHFTPEDMTIDEAKKLLKETTDFDYLKGRVMKIHLGGDYLDTWGYDRDNGQGRVEKLLQNLKGFCEFKED